MENNLTFRYFERSKYSCCSLVGISIGFREINNTIEYGLAIRSNKDNHSKKIAKTVITNRFKKKQILTVPISDNLKTLDNVTKTGQLRNSIIIKLFIALYNYKLIDPKSLGLSKLPAGELVL